MLDQFSGTCTIHLGQNKTNPPAVYSLLGVLPGRESDFEQRSLCHCTRGEELLRNDPGSPEVSGGEGVIVWFVLMFSLRAQKKIEVKVLNLDLDLKHRLKSVSRGYEHVS